MFSALFLFFFYAGGEIWSPVSVAGSVLCCDCLPEICINKLPVPACPRCCPGARTFAYRAVIGLPWVPSATAERVGGRQHHKWVLNWNLTAALHFMCVEARSTAENDRREGGKEKEEIKKGSEKKIDAGRWVAYGRRQQQQQHRLWITCIWSVTWFLAEFSHQGEWISCLCTSYNESHNDYQQLSWYITPYYVRRQGKLHQLRYFSTFSDSHHAFPLPRSLSGLLNQQNRVWEAGSRAQTWLVTCHSSDSALSIWAPSSRLSLKRGVLMGRQPKESYGICKEILQRTYAKNHRKAQILYKQNQSISFYSSVVSTSNLSFFLVIGLVENRHIELWFDVSVLNV